MFCQIPFFYTFVTKDSTVHTFDGFLSSAHTRTLHWSCRLDTPELIFTLSTPWDLFGFLQILVD